VVDRENLAKIYFALSKEMILPLDVAETIMLAISGSRQKYSMLPKWCFDTFLRLSSKFLAANFKHVDEAKDFLSAEA